MSDQIDDICAEAGKVLESEKARQETLLEVTRKGQEGDAIIAQDGGDLAGLDAQKTLPGKNNSRNTSPTTKTSKRKRKNRRRREKRDAINASGGSDSELGTGTEECSQNSEETSKQGDECFEAGTDIEMELDSLPCADTSNNNNKTVASTPVGEKDVAASGSVCIEMTHDKQEEAPPSQPAPTHTVDTLAEIAEQKLNVTETFPASPAQIPDETEKQTCKVAERQKSLTKSVHFNEGPPEVLPPAFDFSESSGEKIFQLDLNQAMADLAKSKSREAMILVKNVGATDSAASMESTGSLLKGTGSSCEDVGVDQFCHYPSLETVKEGQAAAIQSFKVRNPEETKFLVEEVDKILSKGYDKFTAVTGPKNPSEPVLLSYRLLDEDQEVVPKPALSQEDVTPNAGGSSSTTAESSEINTTFIVCSNEEGKGGDAEDAGPSPVLSEASPILEGKGSTEANLSVVFEVPEEDPTLELESSESPPPHQSVSEASTLFEALSVQYIPSDNSTHQKSSDSEVKDKDSDGVYDNSEDENLTKAFIAETESEVDSEDNQLDAKKGSQGPVQLLTLHFPSTAAASASHQETNFDGGDQPYMHVPVDNNNPVLENVPSPPQDFRGDPNYDTESDCPWLPERKESLTKVLSDKDKQNGNKGGTSAGIGSKLAKRGSMKRGSAINNLENNLDEQEPGQGCNCAKMCIIM